MSGDQIDAVSYAVSYAVSLVHEDTRAIRDTLTGHTAALDGHKALLEEILQRLPQWPDR